VFNAAFRITMCGRAPDLGAGIDLARDTIESGRAHSVLERWRAAQ
jgi:anthranilate phosphoribosyltransferase